jgi:hypothetical protein
MIVSARDTEAVQFTLSDKHGIINKNNKESPANSGRRYVDGSAEVGEWK